MKLHVLGTAGYHPNDQRHTACLMLPSEGIILDAGTSFFRTAQLIETDLLHIFLSHAHLDHTVGLTYLLDVLHGRSLKGVFVHGEEVKLAAIREHLFSEHLFPVSPPFDDRPMAPGDRRTLESGVIVSSFRLKHPGNSVAYRFDWPDRSMAYVTDTTACVDADYVQFISDVDLLVHECNFPDELRDYALKTGHSHTTAVAEVAAAANVGQLLLLHFNPLAPDDDPIGLPVARAIFPQARLARDGDVVEF